MYPQRKFQALLIREDQRRFKRRRYVSKSRKQSVPHIVREKIKKYLSLFLETSSVHGLNHLVATGRHPCEM